MTTARTTVAAVAAGLTLAACGSSSSSSNSSGTSSAAGAKTPKVPTRTPLAASTKALGAPGRTLGLARVVIPAHTALPVHYHEGTQAAYIDQGTLTYAVRAGGVDVMQGTPGASPRVVRHIGPGQTSTIAAGQWIVEQPNTIHSGSNATGSPVVVLQATLLRTGAPSATPVK